jgi:serine/threonine protein kinase
MKPENVLIFDNVAKLADFGLSYLSGVTIRPVSSGSEVFMAPEMLCEYISPEEFSRALDNWVLGLFAIYFFFDRSLEFMDYMGEDLVAFWRRVLGSPKDPKWVDKYCANKSELFRTRGVPSASGAGKLSALLGGGIQLQNVSSKDFESPQQEDQLLQALIDFIDKTLIYDPNARVDLDKILKESKLDQFLDKCKETLPRRRARRFEPPSAEIRNELQKYLKLIKTRWSAIIDEKYAGEPETKQVRTRQMESSIDTMQSLANELIPHFCDQKCSSLDVIHLLRFVFYIAVDPTQVLPSEVTTMFESPFWYSLCREVLGDRADECPSARKIDASFIQHLKRLKWI